MLGEGQLLLFTQQLGVLDLQVLDLRGQPGLASESLTGQVLATHADRLLRLRLQLRTLLLELGDLQFNALATRRDVGHAATYLRQEVHLPLVTVVEGLARVLGLVERAVCLGPEDQGDALPQTHGVAAPPHADQLTVLPGEAS